MLNYTKFIPIFMTSLILGSSAAAEMDTSKTLTTKRGEDIYVQAISVKICKLHDETIDYTLYEKTEGGTFLCALTYKYIKADKIITDEKLIKYSKSNKHFCREHQESLVEQVQTLGFKCQFSGIG